MRNKFIVISFLVLSLSACVSPPGFYSDEITANDIIENLKCEIIEAIERQEKPHKWLLGFEASVLLDLQVQRKNMTSGDASLTVPLNPGRAVPKLATNITTTATRTLNTKTLFSIKEIQSNYCPDQEGQILLEGDLGLNDFLERVRYVNENKTHKLTESFYKLKFKITKSLTPSSVWSLIPVSENTFGASVSSAFSSDITHTLTFTITPLTPTQNDKPPATEVALVRDDINLAKQIALEIEKSRIATELKIIRMQIKRGPESAVPDTSLDAKLKALEAQQKALEKEKIPTNSQSAEKRTRVRDTSREKARQRLRDAELRGLLQERID